MELRHLTYFVAVAEVLNISAAARRLRISQPALSRQVRDLEQELGVELFERGRRLRLTQAGEGLLEHARRVLNDAAGFRQHAAGLRGSDAGLLRVGATPQTLERLFPAVLSRFAKTHPRVEVQLTEAHPEAVLELLHRGDLHLGLGLHQPGQPGSRLLGAVPLFAVSRAGPRQRLGMAARGAKLEVRELGSVPLLVLSRGFGSRQLFDAACRVAQLTPHVVLESTAAATLLALARAGHGVAILPGTVTLKARGVRLQRLSVDGAPLEAQIAVHRDVRRFLSGHARAFCEELVVVAQKEYARWSQLSGSGARASSKPSQGSRSS